MSDQGLRFRRTLANFGRPLSDDRLLFAPLRRGCSSEILNLTPRGDQSGHG